MASRTEILAELEEIFRDTLQLPTLQLTENTDAAKIPEWDSLNNVYLILAMENHYQIKFLTQDMQNWKNVGEIITSIEKSIS